MRVAAWHCAVQRPERRGPRSRVRIMAHRQDSSGVIGLGSQVRDCQVSLRFLSESCLNSEPLKAVAFSCHPMTAEPLGPVEGYVSPSPLTATPRSCCPSLFPKAPRPLEAILIDRTPHFLSMRVQVLGDADSKTRLDVQEIYWLNQGQGCGEGAEWRGSWRRQRGPSERDAGLALPKKGRLGRKSLKTLCSCLRKFWLSSWRSWSQSCRTHLASHRGALAFISLPRSHAGWEQSVR